MKGFNHRIVGNTATDCDNSDVNIMRRYPWNSRPLSLYNMNNDTLCRNNAGGKISGQGSTYLEITYMGWEWGGSGVGVGGGEGGGLDHRRPRRTAATDFDQHHEARRPSPARSSSL